MQISGGRRAQIPRFQYFTTAAFFLTVLIFFSCRNSGTDTPPDISGEKITLQVSRLDRDLAALDTNHLAAGLNDLRKKYPDFLDFYFNEVLNDPITYPYSDTQSAINKSLKSFLSHKDCRGTLDTVARHYPDTKAVDEDIKKGLAYLHHYDSSFHFNRIVYFTTCLQNWGAITFDTTTIGVGLDMFLGADYPFYQSVGVPVFQARNLERKNIVPAVFSVIYRSRYPLEIDEHDLLSLMVQEGKRQYFLSKVVPFVPDSVRFGYTAAQMDWCRKSEAGIYNFFVHQKYLYEKNQQKIVRYIQDGPRNQGMPEQSPGSVGVYTGYCIVRAFIDAHPKMSLNEMLAINNAQQILEEARYNPK